MSAKREKSDGPDEGALSLDEAIAAIAAHLGIVNEQEINNMSFIFFKDVLHALGRKLNYDSVSNLYGNSFCKDAGKYISEANPLLKERHISSAFMGLLSQATMVTEESPTTSDEELQENLGDVSWAEGLFD